MKDAAIFFSLATITLLPLALVADNRARSKETQPAIQTVIVNVRGCDVVQYVQNDKLITAHNAADQPKTCKVRYAK